MKKVLHVANAWLCPAENYQLASYLYLKLLAVIYFIAFFSLSTQITGLVGENGILPFTEQLEYIYSNYGVMAWLYKPTLFWFDSGDLALQAVCLLGCVLSVFLLIGFKPLWSLIGLFVLYLSLLHAGQTFLMFQWDTLLLEAGFLAIFLNGAPSHLLLFLFHWLLFRLRFMSGVSKISSGDPSWSNLTTLNYYFETQPLPHAGAWFFHQLPEWILQCGVVLVLLTELIVPFFIFLPRKFRLSAAGITICLQLIIIATSNHNWINLLTIVLCLFLLDDDFLKKVLPTRFCCSIKCGSAGGSSRQVAEKDKFGELLHGSNRVYDPVNAQPVKDRRPAWRNYILPAFALMIMVSSVTAFSAMVTHLRLPETLDKATTLIRLWGIGHIYHVFPNMQTERHEMELQGSDDGIVWQTYVFRYKPGALDKRPVFNVPHQPRLDWMVWFVPPRSADMMYWYDRFVTRVHEGSPQVLDLLEYNPFPDRPPRYLRI